VRPVSNAPFREVDSAFNSPVARAQSNGLHFEIPQQHNKHAALIAPANFLAMN